MKCLINRVYCSFSLTACSVIFFVSVSALLFGVSLSPNEIQTVNKLSDFIEARPVGKDYAFCVSALRSGNELVKGVSAIILFKHYGKALMPFLVRSFTTNPAVGRFKIKKPMFVSLDGVKKMLDTYGSYLKKIDDERIRRLFLFYHFRENNVYFVEACGEKLSLAEFYRIAAFEAIMGEKYDSLKLALQIKLTKPKNTKQGPFERPSTPQGEASRSVEQ